jgi:hypothetical protein
LLEVAGSLHLFGGLAQLQRRLRSEFFAMGFTVEMASAPVAMDSGRLGKIQFRGYLRR